MSSQGLSQETRLQLITALEGELARRKAERNQRGALEASLIDFHKGAWPRFDPATYLHNWSIDAAAEHLTAVTHGYIKRLIITQPPRTMKSSLVSVSWPAWCWAQPKRANLAGPHVKYIGVAYSPKLAIRDAIKSRRVIDSPWYQDRWRDRFHIMGDKDQKAMYENSAGGFRFSTSISGELTGEGGDILIVDDPINAKKANWESARETVNTWWDETVQTRLNDLATGAFVIIMQRLHEDDLVGHILGKEDGWVHLNLPMEFDPSLDTRTWVEGWSANPEEPFFEDPRVEDGELLWPERFPPEAIERLKISLGPFACTPAESPILMSDLSMKPIAQVKVGDEVVGFTTDTAQASKRRILIRSKVSNVFNYQAEIVKVTLSSGRVVRCTPDHQWYMGKQSGNSGFVRKDGSKSIKPMYRPAIVGRRLMRVCPPELEQLTPAQEREAGWLAGFFDGEGSASNCEKRGQRKLDGDTYRPSVSIVFYQSAEKNLPICNRLEKILESLGFSYTAMRLKRDNPGWQEARAYRLTNTSLPLIQKFLHTIQPEKWRDRILEGAYGSKFIHAEETVTAIESDGIETVYALETETGNYVVWGLASANSSAQLQQSPTPRGGGIIDRQWWQVWPAEGFEADRFPPCSLIVGSIDTAYAEKEKEMDNAFHAMSVWGVFQDKRERPGVVMMEAWRNRLPLRGMIPQEARTEDERRPYWGLAEKVADTIRRRQIDIVLIENKTKGGDLEKEVRRLLKGFECQILLLNPEGNKVARLHAVQPMFSDGRVFAPEKAWAETVITEVSQFPKSKYKDYTDTVSMCLSWMRNSGVLMLGTEADDENVQASRFRSAPKPVYDVGIMFIIGTFGLMFLSWMSSAFTV